MIGVELDAENARLARKNVAPFGDRCTIIHAAAADVDGELSYTPVTGEEWGYRAGTEGEIAVDALSLDTLLRRVAPGRPVDYLKVDVEGAEQAIFRAGGDWAEQVRALKCEVHPPYTVDDAASDLRALGFDVAVDDQHFSCVIGRRP
jgi:FkbM family methyltransferase